jgi:hypothetical protein
MSVPRTTASGALIAKCERAPFQARQSAQRSWVRLPALLSFFLQCYESGDELL